MEVEGKSIRKTTIEKMEYEIKEDKLYLRSNSSSDLIVVNLNTIRDIKIDVKDIVLWIEDKKETKIKISVI